MDIPGYDAWKLASPYEGEDDSCRCGEEPRNVFCCDQWWGDICFEAHRSDAHPTDPREGNGEESDDDRNPADHDENDYSEPLSDQDDEPDYLDDPERGE